MSSSQIDPSEEKDAQIVNDALPVEDQGGFYAPDIDPVAEAKLLRRIDIFTLSVLGSLYLMCFLDRANIGSANVATPSMSTALGLTPQQYGAAVSVVYATYVVFEPIWANLLKILTPKYVLSGCTLAWGVLTICMPWAGGYNGVLAIRILLGMFEAGLLPCITMYLMMTYRREETGRRVSYFFVCAALAGAVGGLIAYGLVHIETGSLVGWQYLYLVEGAISLSLAPLAFFWIPNRVDQAWYLNAEQKKLAALRIELNKAYYNQADKFTWEEVFRALKDWKNYCSGVIQFSADFTLYSISTFMPQIVKAMGFSNVNAQLLTVPVYMFGAASFLVAAHISDKWGRRGPIVILGLVLPLIGYIILATVNSVGGRYFSLYVVAAGLYISPGLNLVWIGNNSAGHFKRATSVGLNQLIGNSSGAAIGSIFLSTLAPRYYRSLYIGIGVIVIGIVAAVFQILVLGSINKKRAEQVRSGVVDQPELGDANPHFQFWL